MDMRDLLSVVGAQRGTDRYRRMRSAYWSIRAMRSQRSYSQYGEDVIMLSMMGTGPGKYVDIGAGQPIRGSNTYAFYRRGWSGVLIEPVPRNVSDLRLLRRRDIIVHALCGAAAGTAEVFEFEAYEYTTTSLDRVHELQCQGLRPIASYRLPVIPLSEMDVDATPYEPTILSIDVEGSEVECLLGNDWARFLPAMVCVEDWNFSFGRSSEVAHLLEERGYELRAFSCISAVYLHQDARQR